MTQKEAHIIANLIWDEGYPEGNLESSLIKSFPKVKEYCNMIASDAREQLAKDEERREDYFKIGLDLGGRIFCGNSIKFLVDSNAKEQANKIWNKKYGVKYPDFI